MIPLWVVLLAANLAALVAYAFTEDVAFILGAVWFSIFCLVMAWRALK